MAEETNIPEWAFDEASRRAREESKHAPGATYSNAVAALARMIAEHEQPPVDRATHIAREMLAIWSETTASGAVQRDSSEAEEARKGGWDTFGDFMRARDYLAKELGCD